jgi:hypothetical protein
MFKLTLLVWCFAPKYHGALTIYEHVLKVSCDQAIAAYAKTAQLFTLASYMHSGACSSTVALCAAVATVDCVANACLFMKKASYSVASVAQTTLLLHRTELPDAPECANAARYCASSTCASSFMPAAVDALSPHALIYALVYNASHH